MQPPLANPRDAIYYIYILLMTRQIVYYSIWHCILLRLRHKGDANATSIFCPGLPVRFTGPHNNFNSIPCRFNALRLSI